MTKKKEKGFTLIELIGVLVIMAIIALIVTPLVMNIIRKARVAADKRSIDAYGRSIELAIAGYLLDTGKFPTEVSQLTIEYSGSQVVCETTQINTDSSVYLAGCTVAGRSVENYTYGKKDNTYKIGDTVTYNGIDYYVIENSGIKESTIKLLKAEPLSYAEVQTYSYGTGAQNELHDYGDEKGNIGGMIYHSSSNAYEGSYIKTTVDAWKTVKASAATEARLITIDELARFDYEYTENNNFKYYKKTEFTPDWIYNDNYFYWTMTPYNDFAWPEVWYVAENGDLYHERTGGISGCFSNTSCGWGAVRPVIVLPKSALN